MNDLYIKYNKLFNIEPDAFMEHFVEVIYLIFLQIDIKSDGHTLARTDLINKVYSNSDELLDLTLLLRNYLSIVLNNVNETEFLIADDIITFNADQDLIVSIEQWVNKTIIYTNKKKNEFYKLKFIKH